MSLDPLSGELDRTVVHCPYCGYESEPEDLITEERWDYIGGIIDEVYLRPAMDQILSAFDGMGSSGGFLSIRVETTNPFLLRPLSKGQNPQTWSRSPCSAVAGGSKSCRSGGISVIVPTAKPLST